MVKMDPSSPAHVTVEDRIEAHNRKLEADKAAEMNDIMLDMMEYGNRLWHDRNNPRNTFRGIPGLDPTRQD